MKFPKVIPLAIVASFLSIASNASAQNTFPFVRSVGGFDFFSAEDAQRFVATVKAATGHSFFYVDWSFRSAALSDLFGLKRPEQDSGDALRDLDQELCEAVDTALKKSGHYTFGGRPDPDDNHFLIEFDLRSDKSDPFIKARCEYSGPNYGLRVRGFFYVTDYAIATADRYEFTSAPVAADRVPADFFKSGQ